MQACKQVTINDFSGAPLSYFRSTTSLLLPSSLSFSLPAQLGIFFDAGMSSTYAHYQSEGPASLPSDYAILSSSLSHSLLHQHQQGAAGEDSPYAHGRTQRDPRPTIGTRVGEVEATDTGRTTTERTPLLATPSGASPYHSSDVPTIEETVDAKEDTPSLVMFFEELAILTRYSLPVFVYVSRFRFLIRM